MCFEKNHGKGREMEKIKDLVNQIVTGIKNKTGLSGFFTGNYPMAIIILKF